MTSPTRRIAMIWIVLAAPVLAIQEDDLSVTSVREPKSPGAAAPAVVAATVLEPAAGLPHPHLAAAAPGPAAPVAFRHSARPVAILRPRGRPLRQQIAAAGLVATAAAATCAILEWGGRNAGSHRARTARVPAFDIGDIAGSPAAKRVTAAPAGRSRLDSDSWGASDYLSAAIIGAGIALPFLSGSDNDVEDESRVSVRPMGRRPGLLWTIGLGR